MVLAFFAAVDSSTMVNASNFFNVMIVYKT